MKRGQGISLGIGLLVLGGGYFAYTGIRKQALFKKIAAAIGSSALNLTNYDQYFNTDYFKGFGDGNYLLITDGKALQLANKLDDSWSSQGNIIDKYNPFNYDDEAAIYGVFRQIPDGVALSQVSAKYAEKFGDLKSRVNDMSKDEINIIAGIIAQYPAYRLYSGGSNQTQTV